MNKLEKPPQNDVAGPRPGKQTTQVMVGNVAVGGGAPIVVQSMTNTDTADIDGTVAQVAALARAGSEMVRITVDREEAAAAVPHIRDGLRKRGITTPLIGDFHYIGHKLLADYPACAEALDKYRINPGNVGFKNKRDSQFTDIVEIAIKNNKAVRIGANWGSLDQELLTKLMDENAALAEPARCPRGDPRGHGAVGAIVGGARRRNRPAEEQDDPVGEGVGRAGSDRGLSGTGAAVRLRDPSWPHRSRHGIEGHRRLVRGARHPAAGRHRRYHPHLADARSPAATARWKCRSRRNCCRPWASAPSCRWSRPARAAAAPPRPRSRNWRAASRISSATRCRAGRRGIRASRALNVAVMGCIVNGPGESKHANIGISLPGTGETPAAPVFVDGKKFRTLRGPTIATEFKALVIDYIDQRYGAGSKVSADVVTAAE